MKNKRFLFELIVIFFLGLIPFLWFENGKVVLGHDAGLTLNPIPHFFDRLYLWTERFAFGHDQTYAIPGFFIHGLEALIASTGVGIQMMQKIMFSFWFVFPGITMYIFARKLAKQFKFEYFALPVSIFYMFNHFLLQGWFIAERTKFSVYAAMPLFLLLLWDWQDKKRGTFLTACLIAFVFLFLNGLGSPPLFGGILLLTGVFILFYLLQKISLSRMKEIGLLFLLIGIFSFLYQAYWLLPFLSFVSQSYASAVSQAGGASGISGWINYISQDTSLYNIFRLQGFPDWYQNTKHPYANEFLFNPFLILISFLIPFLAFLPLLLYKKPEIRVKLLFFTCLALVTMVFMAGSHPPFGSFYMFLVNHVPGFIAFRTPYYKFAPSLWFAYALLIGFSIQYILIYLQKRTKQSFLLLLAICVGIIMYSYPFLNGMFFDYMKDERTMRVAVPDYIYEFGEWSDSGDRKTIRSLSLPPVYTGFMIDTFTWDYWSLAPLSTLLTNAPMVNLNVYADKEETELLRRLYNMMKNNRPGWDSLAKRMGIQSFLLRRDFAWDAKGSPTDNPVLYEKALQNPNIKLVKKFGEWEVYDFKNNEARAVNIATRAAYVVGDVTDMADIATLASGDDRRNMYIFDEDLGPDDTSQLLQYSDEIFVNPECVHCDLRPINIDANLYIPVFTHDSIFYNFMNRSQKKEETAANVSEEKQLQYKAKQSMVRLQEVLKLLDEHKEKQVIMNVWQEYINYLRQIEQIEKNISREDMLRSNDILLEVNTFLRLEKEITEKKQEQIRTAIGEKEFKQMSLLLTRVFAISGNKAWVTKDLTDKRYFFDIPEKGDYELFIDSSTFSQQNTASKRIHAEIDTQQIDLESVPAAGYWHSLGTYQLPEGKHTLLLKDEPLADLYQADDKWSLHFEQKSTQQCKHLPTITAEASELLSIQIRYKHISGKQQAYFLRTPHGESVAKIYERDLAFLPDGKVHLMDVDYVPINNRGFYFSICVPETTEVGNKTDLSIESIDVYRVTKPESVFVKKKNIQQNTTFGTVSTKRISQTAYEVSSESPLKHSFVSTNESKNANWKLTDANSIAFTANGYANGWFIIDDKQKISIKYKAQDLLYIGTLITISSLVVTCVYALRKKKKKSKK